MLLGDTKQGEDNKYDQRLTTYLDKTSQQKIFGQTIFRLHNFGTISSRIFRNKQ